ncbi:uncharacterized protein LOC133726490 [Rosa rugosa]|uniref:uncharacterized protein LOC133726490 n=1 Tax=Rosa rugosa TaxID=74645 RepID=UPI002B40DCC4|nr:uncharacterized protein LOC133726490 [Rosa rugosa]
MDSRHASLGRRTLEEIRQKRAAERLSKTSSRPDLSQIPPIDNGGMRKSESANRLSESDVSTLVSQIRDLDRKNAELEEENKNLASMVGLLCLLCLFVSFPKVFTSRGFGCGQWSVWLPNYIVDLYRLGKEADNNNIAVGSRGDVVDNLFVGKSLNRDSDIIFDYR